ncbi:hypothetical protein VTH82DRAFT_1204 [Thermothelomyces myriococcoides]
MRTSSALVAVATLNQITHGLALPERRHGPKVLGLEMQRRAPRNLIHRDRKLRKRGTLEIGLDNEETLYFINGTVGTPPNPVRLHLDTGSSDLWVNTPSSELCSSSDNPCAFAGTYSANSSSTYEYISSNFNISYVDGSGASGDYVSDTVTIGSQKIDRLQFGIGYSSTNSQGILGIGYPLNEVQVGRAGLPPYNNLPAQLVADGVIRSMAYSIWLNDLDANTGNILFGGVDTEKYTPPLLSVPVESASDAVSEFMITLTGLKLGSQTIGPPELAIAVLLDTGSSLTYLPDALVSEIYAAVGAVFDGGANAAYVPCSLARNESAPPLVFTFSEPAIAVGMDELVLDLAVTGSGGGGDGGSSSNGRPTFDNGAPACLFGIGPAGAGTFVLGDTFLRSAYVVYDMENDQVALAPARFNASASSRVVEIGSGPDAIPGATRVSNPVKPTDGLRGVNVRTETAAAARAGLGGGGGGTMRLMAACATLVLVVLGGLI